MKAVYIDIVILIISITSFIQGWKKGFVHLILRTVGYIGGGILGLVLARNYSLHHKPPFNATVFIVAALIIGAMTGDAIGTGCAALIHKKLLPEVFAQLDSVLGGVIGLLRTFIAVAISLTVILSLSSGSIHRSVASSKSYQLLHSISPQIVATALGEAKKLRS
jgi:uncharacterized membrane protein required for colicin V production